jgi:hypothetical protein
MRLRFVLALAATFAGVLWTTPFAHAQQPPPSGQTIRFHYHDNEGDGLLFVTDQGADPSSGGELVSIDLQQGGVDFPGDGMVFPIQTAQPPLMNLLVFWVVDPAGDTFFFEGITEMGVDTISGGGAWFLTTDPSVSEQWTIFKMFGGP